MNNKTKQKLELIVEKGNKLRDFSFENHVAQVGLGFKGTRQEDGSFLLEFGIPDTKERDAFLLTFRLFYQVNESISFPSLRLLLKDPSLSEEFKNQVTTIRQTFFDYITGYSDNTVNFFEGHPSRKRMIDVGLNGGLAHANRPEMIKQYHTWARDDVSAYIFEQEFTRFLIRILGLIYQLAESSQNELNRNRA